MAEQRTQRDLVEMRRRAILDTLREHPWSTANMLHQRILDETGGPPALLTGALWIGPWTVLRDLRRMEAQGVVESRKLTPRNVLWRVV